MYLYQWQHGSRCGHVRVKNRRASLPTEAFTTWRYERWTAKKSVKLRVPHVANVILYATKTVIAEIESHDSNFEIPLNTFFGTQLGGLRVSTHESPSPHPSFALMGWGHVWAHILFELLKWALLCRDSDSYSNTSAGDWYTCLHLEATSAPKCTNEVLPTISPGVLFVVLFSLRCALSICEVVQLAFETSKQSAAH